MIDALALHGNASAGAIPGVVGPPGSASAATTAALVAHKERLRAQMRAEALALLAGPDGDEDQEDEQHKREKEAVSAIDQWDSHMLEEATQFLRLQVRTHVPTLLPHCA